MNRALSRTGRTFLQLVAAGGLTGIVAAIASGLGAWASAVVLAVGMLVTTFTQNYLEGNGTVGTILEDRPAPAEKAETWVDKRLATDEGNRPRRG